MFEFFRGYAGVVVGDVCCVEEVAFGRDEEEGLDDTV